MDAWHFDLVVLPVKNSFPKTDSKDLYKTHSCFFCIRRLPYTFCSPHFHYDQFWLSSVDYLYFSHKNFVPTARYNLLTSHLILWKKLKATFHELFALFCKSMISKLMSSSLLLIKPYMLARDSIVNAFWSSWIVAHKSTDHVMGFSLSKGLTTCKDESIGES